MTKREMIVAAIALLLGLGGGFLIDRSTLVPSADCIAKSEMDECAAREESLQKQVDACQAGQ